MFKTFKRALAAARAKLARQKSKTPEVEKNKDIEKKDEIEEIESTESDHLSSQKVMEDMLKARLSRHQKKEEIILPRRKTARPKSPASSVLSTPRNNPSLAPEGIKF